MGWQPAFFHAIGLQSVIDNDFRQLGGPTPKITPNLSPGHSHRVHESQEGVFNWSRSLSDLSYSIIFTDNDGKRGLLTAGLPVGRGLTVKAAEELGLLEGTPVGSGVIDAYVHISTSMFRDDAFLI